VDDASSAGENLGSTIDQLSVAEPEAESRRIYVTGTFRRRLHQRSFRERVLAAYRRQCALCRLRHEELLEAAHIIPDSENGEPVVSNGLSLCKIHHAAYDRRFIGVRPDRVVEVRADLLAEEDGPMLRHGLQGMHGQPIHVPRRQSDQPDPAALERRYERFVAQSV
jgi:putative restriction endonuclease